MEESREVKRNILEVIQEVLSYNLLKANSMYALIDEVSVTLLVEGKCPDCESQFGVNKQDEGAFCDIFRIVSCVGCSKKLFWVDFCIPWEH